MSEDYISDICSANISNNAKDNYSHYFLCGDYTDKNSSSDLDKSMDETTIVFAMSGTIAISPFGILGNLVIIYIFNRPIFVKSTPAIFLKGLASFDLLYLLSWSFVFLLCLCRVTLSRTVYIGACILALDFWQCSNWSLVLITAERITAVFLPHKAKIIWTKYRCKFAILMMIILLTIINTFLVFLFILQLKMPEIATFSPKLFLTVNNGVDTWTVYVISSLLPGIPIICGNCLIVWKLWTRKKQWKTGITTVGQTRIEHGHNQINFLSASVLKFSPKLPSNDEIVSDITTTEDGDLDMQMNVKNAKDTVNGKCLPSQNVHIHKQIRHPDSIVTDSNHSNRNSKSENPLVFILPPNYEINPASATVDGFGLQCSRTKLSFSKRLSKSTGDGKSVTNDDCNKSDHRTLHELRTEYTVKSNNPEIKPKAQTNKSSSTNGILIFICIIFMATNIPPTLHSFYMRFVVWSKRTPSVEELSTNFVLSCFGIINSSLNFICYSISGSRFRNELNNICNSCWFCREKSQQQL